MHKQLTRRLHPPPICFRLHGQPTLANGVESGDLDSVSGTPGQAGEGGRLDLRRGRHCRGRDTWSGDAGLVSRQNEAVGCWRLPRQNDLVGPGVSKEIKGRRGQQRSKLRLQLGVLELWKEERVREWGGERERRTIHEQRQRPK